MNNICVERESNALFFIYNAKFIEKIIIYSQLT